MVTKWLEKILNRCRMESKQPWAAFEIKGFEDDGRIKVEFNWNDKFIETIHGLGFIAETEEDSVQLFFYASSMRPTELDGVDAEAATSAEHPNLAADLTTRA
jgi:hypothetical protein